MTLPRFERINVEISNVCNLKCSFCPSVERGKQVLTVTEFERVLSEVAPYTKEVVLHLLGEPLGHPHFEQILNLAHQYAVPVNVVTNGVLLTGDRTKLLKHPIVRQVSFSLHSFEANFPDRDPSVYVGRIKAFVQSALEERPDLYLNLRLWDLSGVNAGDSPVNLRMRDILATAFGFSWEDVTVNLLRRKSWRIAGRLYLHFDSRFEWPDISRSILQERGTCHALKGHIGIHADGTVVPCCLDHNAEMPLGNIFKQSLIEILESPRATALRDGFARGELVEDLCKRCGFIARFARKAVVANPAIKKFEPIRNPRVIL